MTPQQRIQIAEAAVTALSGMTATRSITPTYLAAIFTKVIEICEDEDTTRAADDATLTAAVAAVVSDLATEVSTRAAAVTAEANARSAADTAEATARTTAISEEASARSAADTAEATARSNADTAEATARQAADTALGDRCTALEYEITDADMEEIMA